MVSQDAQGAVLHHDESWYVGCAQSGRCWGERGKPTWIPAFGPTRGEVLYLSRDAVSDELIWSWQPRTRSDNTIAHLEQLLECYRDKRYVVLIWDNASWHKSRRVEGWIADHNATSREQRRPKLFLLPLPTYSPWLNPTEAVINQNKRRTLFGANQPDAARLRRIVETNLTYFHPRKGNNNRTKQH